MMRDSPSRTCNLAEIVFLQRPMFPEVRETSDQSQPTFHKHYIIDTPSVVWSENRLSKPGVRKAWWTFVRPVGRALGYSCWMSNGLVSRMTVWQFWKEHYCSNKRPGHRPRLLLIWNLKLIQRTQNLKWEWRTFVHLGSQLGCRVVLGAFQVAKLHRD